MKKQYQLVKIALSPDINSRIRRTHLMEPNGIFLLQIAIFFFSNGSPSLSKQPSVLSRNAFHPFYHAFIGYRIPANGRFRSGSSNHCTYLHFIGMIKEETLLQVSVINGILGI
ncbi:hypothetical protein CDAR_621101 [Caerostris darwini]|uniref:Uncharacterized protein n=1 Tax=Caerostris darwini TaxID=1538125 RepID=A0AAV4TG69_9ARAC|nr:hypothetical protein CDAR_621101 [Caerostris darwini]